MYSLTEEMPILYIHAYGHTVTCKKGKRMDIRIHVCVFMYKHTYT